MKRVVEALAKLPPDELKPHQKSQRIGCRLNLSKFYGRAGEPEMQKRELRLAKEDADLLFPNPHPRSADVESELGRFHRDSGEHDLARQHFECAILIARRAWGDEHDEIGAHLLRLGRLLLESQSEDARRHLEETVGWYERFYGSSRPELIEPLSFLALACSGEGEEDAARQLFLAALTIAETDGNGLLGVEDVSLSKETLDAELPTLYERVMDAQSR